MLMSSSPSQARFLCLFQLSVNKMQAWLETEGEGSPMQQVARVKCVALVFLGWKSEEKHLPR